MSSNSQAPLPAPHLIISELQEHSSDGPESQVCDVCGERFTGNPGGRGLFMWKRGDEVRFEEPPLCRRCAKAITAAGIELWEGDDGADG